VRERNIISKITGLIHIKILWIFIHSNSYENVNKRDVTVSYLVENSI